MAIKTIYLLRHGQYKKEPSEVLTKLGVKQARLSGKRLKQIKFSRIYFSTMPRAIETADIVKKMMNYSVSMEGSDYLHECVPGFPKKDRKKFGYTDQAILNKHKRNANKAYKNIFTYSNVDTNQLVVCHGNIIRYFVCKALSIDTDNWPKFDIKQCGITVIKLDAKKKKISVMSHNDIGHIPIKMQTFI